VCVLARLQIGWGYVKGSLWFDVFTSIPVFVRVSKRRVLCCACQLYSFAKAERGRKRERARARERESCGCQLYSFGKAKRGRKREKARARERERAVAVNCIPSGKQPTSHTHPFLLTRFAELTRCQHNTKPLLSTTLLRLLVRWQEA